MISFNSNREIEPLSKLEFSPQNTVCFTGHRESKIANIGRYPFELTAAAVKLFLARYVELTVEAGYTRFISGLARGVDLWGAECVIDIRNQGKNLELIGVMPYYRHSGRDNAELKYVEENSDLILCTNSDPNMRYGQYKSKTTSPDIYYVRNKFMVDNSSVVIAFYDNVNNSNSGTGQTLRYAKETHRIMYRFGTREINEALRRSHGDLSVMPEIIREIVPELQPLL